VAKSLLLVLVLQVASLSQPALLWSREYYTGEDSFFREVIQSVTGEYYVAGWAPASCLTKIDQTGELLWSYGLGGWDQQLAYWVEELSDGGIAVTGACRNDEDDSYALFIAKVQPDGSEVWSEINDLDPESSEGGYSITELPNGDIVVCGFCDAGLFLSGYAYIMRLDPAGQLIWDAEWGKNSATNFAIRISYANGVIYTLAHGSDTTGTGAPHVLWYSDDGTYLGRERIDRLASYYTGQGYPNEDSGFTFTANNDYIGDPPSYTTLARVDSLGQIAWLTHVVEDNLTMGISVTGMASGDYLYGGSETVTAGIEQPALNGTTRGVIYSFDPDGNELWRVPVNSNGCERIDGVVETSSGGIIACGGGYPESWLYYFEDTTGIETEPGSQPRTTIRCLPNPFTSTLSVSCTIPDQSSDAGLAVYSLSGNRIESLYSGQLSVGEHSFTWTPESSIPSGCYLIRLRSGNEVLTESCVYLK
jgi:hypothetical protein